METLLEAIKKLEISKVLIRGFESYMKHKINYLLDEHIY